MPRRSYPLLLSALGVLIACTVWVPLREFTTLPGHDGEMLAFDTGREVTRWGTVTSVWNPKTVTVPGGFSSGPFGFNRLVDANGQPVPPSAQEHTVGIAYRVRWPWFAAQFGGAVGLLALLGLTAAGARRRRRAPLV